MQRRDFLSILVAAPFFNVGEIFQEVASVERTCLTAAEIEEFVKLTIPHYSRNKWCDISMEEYLDAYYTVNNPAKGYVLDDHA